MLDGWIKLHRKIRENPIFNDMQLFRLWIICLTEATYKERDQMVGKQLAHLMPGEFVTGRFSLNELYNSGLGRNENKPPTTTWRWLEVLEKNGLVVIKSNNKYSVVSILKWVDYQQLDDQDGQQNGQQMVNNLSTDGQQMVTNKKVKKVNNPKKVEENKIAYSENVTLTEIEYQNLCEKYGKELTDSSISYLTSYKIEKGYKTKSDNLTIQRWVVDAAKKAKVGENNVKHEGFTQGLGQTVRGTQTKGISYEGESRVSKSRWDDTVIPMPEVQGRGRDAS